VWALNQEDEGGEFFWLASLDVSQTAGLWHTHTTNIVSINPERTVQNSNEWDDICAPDRVKQNSSGLVRHRHTCRLNRVPAAIVVVARYSNVHGYRRDMAQEEKVQKLEVMQKLMNIYTWIYTSTVRGRFQQTTNILVSLVVFSLFTYTIENNEQRSSVNCAWCTLYTEWKRNEDGIVLVWAMNTRTHSCHLLPRLSLRTLVLAVASTAATVKYRLYIRVFLSYTYTHIRYVNVRIDGNALLNQHHHHISRVSLIKAQGIAKGGREVDQKNTESDHWVCVYVRLLRGMLFQTERSKKKRTNWTATYITTQWKRIEPERWNERRAIRDISRANESSGRCSIKSTPSSSIISSYRRKPDLYTQLAYDFLLSENEQASTKQRALRAIVHILVPT